MTPDINVTEIDPLFSHARQYAETHAQSPSPAQAQFVRTDYLPLLLYFAVLPAYQAQRAAVTALETRYTANTAPLPLPTPPAPNSYVQESRTRHAAIQTFFHIDNTPNTWTAFRIRFIDTPWQWMVSQAIWLSDTFLLNSGLVLLGVNAVALLFQGFTLLTALVLPLSVTALLSKHIANYISALYHALSGEAILATFQGNTAMAEVLLRNEAYLHTYDHLSLTPLRYIDFDSLHTHFSERRTLLMQLRARIQAALPRDIFFSREARITLLTLQTTVDAQIAALNSRLTAAIDTMHRHVEEELYNQVIVDNVLTPRLPAHKQAELLNFFAQHATQAQNIALQTVMHPLQHLLQRITIRDPETALVRPILQDNRPIVPYGHFIPYEERIHVYNMFCDTATNITDAQKVAYKELLQLLNWQPSERPISEIVQALHQTYPDLDISQITAPIQQYLFDTCQVFNPRVITAFSVQQQQYIILRYQQMTNEIQTMLDGVTDYLSMTRVTQTDYPIEHITPIITLCQIATFIQQRPCTEIRRLQIIVEAYITQFDGAILAPQQLALLQLLYGFMAEEAVNKILTSLAQKRFTWLFHHSRETSTLSLSKSDAELFVQVQSADFTKNILENTFLTCLEGVDIMASAPWVSRFLEAGIAGACLDIGLLQMYHLQLMSSVGPTTTITPYVDPGFLVKFKTQHPIAFSCWTNTHNPQEVLPLIIGDSTQKARNMILAIANLLAPLSPSESCSGLREIEKPIVFLLKENAAHLLAELPITTRLLIARDPSLAKKLLRHIQSQPQTPIFSHEDIWGGAHYQNTQHPGLIMQPALFVDCLLFLLQKPGYCHILTPLLPETIEALYGYAPENSALHLGGIIAYTENFQERHLMHPRLMFASNALAVDAMRVLCETPLRFEAWLLFFTSNPLHDDARTYLTARWRALLQGDVSHRWTDSLRAKSYDTIVRIFKEVDLYLTPNDKVWCKDDTFIKRYNDSPYIRDMIAIFDAHQITFPQNPYYRLQLWLFGKKSPTLFSRLFEMNLPVDFTESCRTFDYAVYPLNEARISVYINTTLPTINAWPYNENTKRVCFFIAYFRPQLRIIWRPSATASIAQNARQLPAPLLHQYRALPEREETPPPRRSEMEATTARRLLLF